MDREPAPLAAGASTAAASTELEAQNEVLKVTLGEKDKQLEAQQGQIDALQGRLAALEAQVERGALADD